MELNLIQVMAIYALPVIFAITLHEAAHGYVGQVFWRQHRLFDGTGEPQPHTPHRSGGHGDMCR